MITEFFKYEQLKQVLIKIKKNHEIVSLRNFDGSNKVVLRFDEDFGVVYSYNVSRVLKELEIDASFLIMTTDYLYNPFTKESRIMLREMVKDGFDVGLHFDPSIYGENYEEGMKKELELLELAIGGKIKSISIHQPSVHGKYPMFKDMSNAYDPRIFGDERYMSDSRRIIKKDIFEFVTRAKNHPVQILLHPQYYSDNGEGFDSLEELKRNELNEQLKAWKNELLGLNDKNIV